VVPSLLDHDAELIGAADDEEVIDDLKAADEGPSVDSYAAGD